VISLLLVSVVQAGSIAASGYLGGPDSGAATPSPAAAHFNPAALAAAPGFQVLVDGAATFVRVDVEQTRNGGIDPNTGEPYATSKARATVPVGILGISGQVWPDRLTLGLAVADVFVGGGDYRAGEPDDEAPWEGSTRYAGVLSKIITLHVIPAVGFTVVDGVHVGGNVKWVYDSIDAIQASDPLGTEGVSFSGPYTGDSYLQIDATGSHIGGGGGLFVDKWKFAQVGLSYTESGRFQAEGGGSVDAPDLVGGGNPDALVTFEADLPPVIHGFVNSQLSDRLTVGAGVEAQLWGVCCGKPKGDIAIGLTSTDGDAIGVDPEDGVVIQIATEQFSPRRLRNSYNVATTWGYAAHDKLWLGGRVGTNTSAVPDYAVSATNLDFANVGAQAAVRFTPSEKFQIGLSYAKFFLFDREITHAAWDVRDTGSPDYVDERFSPKNPYKAGTNGTYDGEADSVGLRIGVAI
jgi:hypothetical protein